uniref:Uncharacterized protein n=1 Tax=Arundo donax TaxID=35708 RepID=A0A0A9DV75_ARUDO
MPINFVGTNLASTEKCFRDDVEYSILPVRNDNINLADTEENFPAGKIGHCKPALDGTESEETVASNGFVAIKRKKATEEHKMKKIPKLPMGRENATSHGNCSTFEQKILVQGHTRSPLADRTNFSEAVAAPTLEFCGKWKCPRKGKPSVGPPMKQLRLEQWLRQEN